MTMNLQRTFQVDGQDLLRLAMLCLPLLLLATAAVSADKKADPPARTKIILDTDIGDDVDDAYALVLLASQPDVQLLGVTTAFGQTRERAELAAKLLSVMGRKEVPVHAGRRGTAAIARQYDWARGYRSPSIKNEAAVEFLRREINRAPGEVTLVAVGPLTNMGDLVTRFPEVKTKIKRLVIMGGAVYVGYNNQAPPTPEWNIKCDPAAAKAVFNSGVPLVMAGLEVTTMMRLEADRQKSLFGHGLPATDSLAALTVLWGNNVPVLYDAVAVAYAMGHPFSESEQKRVEVQDDGLTRLVDGPANATVLVKPRKDEFLDWFVAALKPKP